MTGFSVMPVIRSAAPEEGWRSIKPSTCMASRFLMVSLRVSPLLTLLDAAAKFRVPAPRCRAAISKEKRVRVEFSKKTSAIRLFEREALNEGVEVDSSFLKPVAMSSMVVISLAGTLHNPVRCFKFDLYLWLFRKIFSSKVQKN